MKALIVSDGKIGHLSQSIALCKYKNWDYEIVTVTYKSKHLKAVSYILDRMKFYTNSLYTQDTQPTKADILICTGSAAYYPAKVMAKKQKLADKTVAIMLPKGYKYDFDFILAQSHDNPPSLPNIITLPTNLVQTSHNFDQKEMSKRFVFEPSKQYMGVIIGGSNSAFSMSIDDLRPFFNHILSLKDTGIVVTTSRRTPSEVEDWLSTLSLDFLLRYSQDKFNPIPAFLQNCQNIVITSDSTSMISEAAVGGSSCVDVVMLKSKKQGKFHKLVQNLEALEALHIFDGKLGDKNKKIKLASYLDTVTI